MVHLKDVIETIARLRLPDPVIALDSDNQWMLFWPTGTAPFEGILMTDSDVDECTPYDYLVEDVQPYLNRWSQ